MNKGDRKVQQVMHEHKAGTLTSGSGKKVKSRDQAVAIAMNAKRKVEHGGKKGT